MSLDEHSSREVTLHKLLEVRGHVRRHADGRASSRDGRGSRGGTEWPCQNRVGYGRGCEGGRRQRACLDRKG